TVGLIASTNIGDMSVTLLNAGDASNFAVGNWVCVCGLELQHGGFPPNFQFYEYRLITNISGTTVTLNAPLANQYLSTWPQNDTKDGPAAIWLMDSTWNSNVAIYGLTFIANPQFDAAGRTVALYDVVLPAVDNVAPSTNQTFFSFFS